MGVCQHRLLPSILSHRSSPPKGVPTGSGMFPITAAQVSGWCTLWPKHCNTVNFLTRIRPVLQIPHYRQIQFQIPNFLQVNDKGRIFCEWWRGEYQILFWKNIVPVMLVRHVLWLEIFLKTSDDSYDWHTSDRQQKYYSCCLFNSSQHISFFQNMVHKVFPEQSKS
jgi:hypothetical protein